MTLEVKNHSAPPAGPCYWVFYRPEWVFIGKKFLFKTEQKIIKELDLKLEQLTLVRKF